MEQLFLAGLKGLNGIVWGPAMILLILGTGVFLMARLRFIPIRKLGYGFKQLFAGPQNRAEGEISPFNALMTALSATIGTGNIAGVATAIFIGGPGALFWMWCTALVGMATKYSEAVLAVHYRERDSEGRFVGGPMYYIKNGLGSKWAWLGFVFAALGMLTAFGIGNTVQTNSMAAALNTAFGVEKSMTAVFVFIAVVAVVLGGLKRISEVAGKLVPTMAVLYIIAGIAVVAINGDKIPAAFDLIVTSAFNPVAAVGGFAGSSIMMAVQLGVARGIFSNEAGLGSAAIAHAAANTDNPVRQGVVAMLGTFIDTIIVCTITGFAIIITGVWSGGETGAALTSAAFDTNITWGSKIIAVGLVIFAFTTILGWSYYGERCAQYLLGERAVKVYRVLFCIVVPIGATQELETVWLLADTLNAMMAIPNLIALLLLNGVVVKLTRDYFDTKDKL